MQLKVPSKAYAKVNLSLDITGKLENGYHILRSVMQAVDFFDDVFVETFVHESVGNNNGTLAEPIVIEMHPKDIVPNAKDNLAYKAAAFMAEHFQDCMQGVKIKIDKHIPAAAGLAGGSSDAAAVILALAELWNLDISLTELCALSAAVGADVPFCLIANARNNKGRYADDAMAASTAFAEGIGDMLTPLPSPKGSLILVKPTLSLSTKHIYSVYDEVSEQAARPDTEGFVRALTEGLPVGSVQGRKYMVNALEYAAARESAETANILSRLRGILPEANVFLSGSGPTVTIYFEDTAGAKSALPFVKENMKSHKVEIFSPAILK